MAGTAGEEDQLRDKKQQSILASQRAKESGGAEANGKGRLENLWPLGNAESFKQWVCLLLPVWF